MALNRLLILGALFSFIPLLSLHIEAASVTGTAKDSVQVLQILDKARGIYKNQRFDSVLSLCDSSLILSANADFSRGTAESHFLKARALNRLGHKNKAISSYEKAIEYFESINEDGRIASVYNNWSLILKAMGKFREAIEIGELASKHAASLPNSNLNFHILNNLGNSYQSLAQFKKASTLYFESLQVLKWEKDTVHKEQKQAEVYINLGIVYFEQKLYSKSLEIYHNARSILERHQLKPQLATVYNNLGVAYIETEDYKIAEDYLNKAYELSTELNDKLGEAISTKNLGKIFRAQNQIEIAITNHKQAISDFINLQATEYLATSYLELGKSYIEANKSEDAQLALMRGLQIALKSGQKVQELKLYEGLISFHKSVNEPDMALMYYDLFSALTQELNDQQIGRFIGQQELKEHIEKRDLALKSLENEAALMQFQINQRNMLLILAVSVIVLISVLFTMAYRQHRLKSINRNFILEQRLLRTQLNPHFIFNALGAIQNYIFDKAPNEAARYLSKFSKLMRSVLESSRTNQTSLSTELDTIKYYLDLQALRFTKPFKYIIELDPKLDTELIQIPPLLIQPLLENAIEHGLTPNQGGNLIINIQQETEHVLITVEDDGIGLNNRKHYNQDNKTKKSFGNTITSERLTLLNRRNKNKILFKVENRSNIESSLSGTIASLKIPLN